jgi:hypothetical protein
VDAITVYPNPSEGIFYFSSSMLLINSIEVYNVLGEKIYQLIVNSKTLNSIDLSKQKNGIYFVHFITNKGGVVKRVVVRGSL